MVQLIASYQSLCSLMLYKKHIRPFIKASHCLIRIKYMGNWHLQKPYTSWGRPYSGVASGCGTRGQDVKVEPTERLVRAIMSVVQGPALGPLVGVRGKSPGSSWVLASLSTFGELSIISLS